MGINSAGMEGRETTIEIAVNGKPLVVQAGLSLAELLQTLGTGTRGVAVELEGTVVAAGDFDSVRLSAGQRVEVVRLVGGG